jgi:nucleotide-binding universal stress UspA family protein
MTYQTLMVHLQLGRSNAALLKVAGELAHSFRTDVIGIAAGQPTQMIYGQGYALLDFLNQEHEKISIEIDEAEMAFRSAFKGYSRTIEWRSTITLGSPSVYIAGEACSADIILTEIAQSDFYEGPNSVNAGELVLQSGRPLLAVPVTAKKLKLEQMLVGWKDTREARRAILDALPLLKLAEYVTVVEIVAENETAEATKRLEQVTGWLMRHNITADYLVSISITDDAAQFASIAKEKMADIVIAGAYGHSRLREWVLGGVTNDLLQRAEFCSLLSH